MTTFSCLVRSPTVSGQVRYRLGDPLVDRYLEFFAGRARPNTLRAAVAFDLKTFFTVVSRDPREVAPKDAFVFLAQQRGDRSVVRLADSESGCRHGRSARWLSSVSGFYAFAIAHGEIGVSRNPVPRGLSMRRDGGTRKSRLAHLVRVPRTLPTILSPAEADRRVAAPRTHRDRAMVAAMLFGALRRCEVLGLRLADIQVADDRTP